MQTLTFTIHDPHRGNPVRRIEVAASPDELRRLAAEGYLTRPAMFGGEELAALAEGVDAVEAAERAAFGGVSGGSFGGFFARYLEEKHPVFLRHAVGPGFTGVARAMLGPAVRLTQVSLRVTYPGEPGQETAWHTHRRMIPEPTPAWFSTPHTLDVLVYLDETSRVNGPLAVVPGSQGRHRDQPAADDTSELAGQEVLEVPAGSAVFLHSNLWHRGMPTLPEGAKRRLLIFSYAPAWFRDSPNGSRPEDGCAQRLRRSSDTDAPTRELLGLEGMV